MPNIVLLALYGIAVVAIGFAGYANGVEERRWRLPVYIMSLLVAAVILFILMSVVKRPWSSVLVVRVRSTAAAEAI